MGLIEMHNTLSMRLYPPPPVSPFPFPPFHILQLTLEKGRETFSYWMTCLSVHFLNPQGLFWRGFTGMLATISTTAARNCSWTITSLRRRFYDCPNQVAHSKSMRLYHHEKKKSSGKFNSEVIHSQISLHIAQLGERQLLALFTCQQYQKVHLSLVYETQRTTY